MSKRATTPPSRQVPLPQICADLGVTAEYVLSTVREINEAARAIGKKPPIKMVPAVVIDGVEAQPAMVRVDTGFANALRRFAAKEERDTRED